MRQLFLYLLFPSFLQAQQFLPRPNFIWRTDSVNNCCGFTISYFTGLYSLEGKYKGCVALPRRYLKTDTIEYRGGSFFCNQAEIEFGCLTWKDSVYVKTRSKTFSRPAKLLMDRFYTFDVGGNIIPNLLSPRYYTWNGKAIPEYGVYADTAIIREKKMILFRVAVFNNQEMIVCVDYFRKKWSPNRCDILIAEGVRLPKANSKVKKQKGL